MRAWALRKLGPGSLVKDFSITGLPDRYGDLQLETNIEYRYTIAQIIPNSLVLKGALFADIGNVWNFRNSKPGGGTHSAPPDQSVWRGRHIP